MLCALSLCHRELVRFIRQPNRVIGALATPIVFWLLIGAGVGRSFSGAANSAALAENYIAYFFPGTILMILLFTAIFSTISIIEDRREGFLQSVLVAPVRRSSIVLGKVLGGTVLAVGQATLFLFLAPLVGLKLTFFSALACFGLMLLTAFALTALGFAIAWRMSSTQGFHAIMNLFLMPMWFLSGALFPPGGAWKGLQWVIAANPLSYALAAIRHTLSPGVHQGPSMGLSLAVTVLAAGAMFAVASFVARGTTASDLQ